jgi:hypothetical protein
VLFRKMIPDAFPLLVREPNHPTFIANRLPLAVEVATQIVRLAIPERVRSKRSVQVSKVARCVADPLRTTPGAA